MCEQNKHLVISFCIVKPERIKGLQTYQTKSTIHLKWKCPSTHEGMEFRIRYRSEYARNNNMKEWEVTV